MGFSMSCENVKFFSDSCEDLSVQLIVDLSFKFSKLLGYYLLPLQAKGGR